MIKGTLNMYFPCEVKTTRVTLLRKRWEACRRRQNLSIQREYKTSTDLLDSNLYREQTEKILRKYWDAFFDKAKNTNSPYATAGVKKSYRGLREDMLFSKNLSAEVDSITISFKSMDGTGRTTIEDGRILLNVNAENGVGIFIVNLPLVNVSVQDVILLKHIFYKRLLVTINGREEHTIQQHLADLIYSKFKHLQIGAVDYRARYSMLEIYGLNDFHGHWDDFYGMLKADEMYAFVRKEILDNVFKKNLFQINTCGYYVSDTNAIVIHNICTDDNDCEQKCCLRGLFHHFRSHSLKHSNERASDDARNKLRSHGMTMADSNQISLGDEKFIQIDNVPGTKNNLLPEYLRAVEFHYLLDRVLSSEIEMQRRSAWKVWIVFKRSIKLWNILYDKSINRYHINEDLMEAFGINKSLVLIKEEYDSLQQFILNAILVFLSVLTLATTILSVVPHTK